MEEGGCGFETCPRVLWEWQVKPYAVTTVTFAFMVEGYPAVEILRCVILVAGLGTRLGLPDPKPMNLIHGNKSILDLQLERLRRVFGDELDINLVVGHKAERFDFLRPAVSLYRNDRFAETNTSKSLMVGLEQIGEGPVLWMNGDVVFQESVMLDVAAQTIRKPLSFMVVNQGETGDEEVKYLTDRQGHIAHVGKKLSAAEGEAVGINFLASHDRQVFAEALRKVGDEDYFEAAIQDVISTHGVSFLPLPVEAEAAIEIDDMADLNRARNLFGP